MNEQSITRQLVKSLYSTLRRFVGGLNETDIGTGTGTDGPVSSLDHGWSYPAHETVRERYERDCI